MQFKGDKFKVMHSEKEFKCWTTGWGIASLPVLEKNLE